MSADRYRAEVGDDAYQRQKREAEEGRCSYCWAPPGQPVEFTVPGVAQPAGSKRGFYNAKTRRVIITDDAKKSRPWKAQVSDAAAEAVGLSFALLRGPLCLEVTFVLPRPKGHFRPSGDLNAQGRRTPYPATRPDSTKLLRAVEDACNGLIWKDDAQVVSQHVWKVYGEPARCEVHVHEMQSEEAFR